MGGDVPGMDGVGSHGGTLDGGNATTLNKTLVCKLVNENIRKLNLVRK